MSDRTLSLRRSIFPGIVLMTMAVLVYLPAWHGGFIWDDDAHLTQNPCIVGPLGFKGIWSTSAAIYYPLVLTSFWIEHFFWGLNPLPYHVVNGLLHGIDAVLLWRVLSALRVRGAWLGAALWAVHPVQVETVAWIAEMKNTQSCLFYLLAIDAFLKWLQRGDQRFNGQYALTLLWALMAILSKSSTVMLPVVLGLCWWWMGNWRARNAAWLAPLAMISAAAAAWSVWEEKFLAGAVGAGFAQTWPERFIIAGKASWFYLCKLVWPAPLILIYPRWKIDPSNPVQYIPALTALVGLAVLWRMRRGRARPTFFAAAYFIVSLFPVLGFFNVHYFLYSFVADHFQYLASMGPLALAGAAIAAAAGYFKNDEKAVYRILAGTALGTMVLFAWMQARTYANAETLYRTTIEKNPGCWMAYNNLGALLAEAGDGDGAVQNYLTALNLNPNYPEAHNNLGNFLLQKGDVDAAIEHFQRSAEIQPGFPATEGNLGNAYMQKGDVESAIAHFENALKADPRNKFAESGLGVAFAEKGEMQEAAGHFQKAMEIDPGDAATRYDYANLLLKTGRPSEAIAQLEKALEIQPAMPAAQMTLAWTLATCGDVSLRNGIKALAMASELDRLTKGSDPTVLEILAAADAETGDYQAAAETAQKALQLADAQSNAELAKKLPREIQFYQSGQRYTEEK